MIAMVGAPLDAHAQSAAVSPSPAGLWQGKASEYQGIYSGPVSANVTLDLRPDGTFTETWKEGARQWTTSGTWRQQRNGLVLESSDRSHARLALRRRGDALYTVAMEPMPTGRTTTTAIELYPAP